MTVLALLLFLQPPTLLAGCGAGGSMTEEEVVQYALENILVPREREEDFIVEWLRRSTGAGDVSPQQLAQRAWKWEGGSLIEISLEEYEELAAMREGGDPDLWIYSQHSITVFELDEKKGEAVVEIGTLYGPLAGSGTRYLLRKEDGEWKTVSEQTVWVS